MLSPMANARAASERFRRDAWRSVCTRTLAKLCPKLRSMRARVDGSIARPAPRLARIAPGLGGAEGDPSSDVCRMPALPINPPRPKEADAETLPNEIEAETEADTLTGPMEADTESPPL